MMPQPGDRELLEEVIVAPRRAFPRLPEVQVIERPGWLQIVTPTLVDGGLNEVIACELGEAEAPRVVDETIAQYRALGVRFRWRVAPGTTPAGLGALLEGRGLVRSWSHGMARSTEPIDAPSPRVRVVEVDDTTIDAYSHAMAAAWGSEPGPLAALNARILALPDRAQHLFLAYLDDAPVGTAAYVAFARSAYLLGGAVLPGARGHGVYRALIAARLAAARARGIPLATSHALATTSAPILAHLGFATVCRFPSFRG